MSALQSGCYEITWEVCADLPSPMYHASAVLHNEKVHVMAGNALHKDTYLYVFSYDIFSNHWDKLPPPGHIQGVLQVIDGKLSVIGGRNNLTTKKATNKVSTFINNNWTSHYPTMLKARWRPGVAAYLDYIIVAGGLTDIDTDCDDIELLHYKQPPHWIKSNVSLPNPMDFISLTISDDLLYIVGYGTTTVRFKEAYKVSVKKITSTVMLPPTSNQWIKISSPPHYFTTTIPNTCPPLILGGASLQGVPTADVAMLMQSWIQVSSLSSSRLLIAVVPINCESILVIGGTTGGNSLNERAVNSISTVEKGTVKVKKQSHTVAAVQNTHCIIQ